MGVALPVDHRELWMASRSGGEYLVHADVLLLPLPHVGPENPLDACCQQRVDRVLDALSELVSGVVVTHLDEHGRSESRSERVDDVQQRRDVPALEWAAHAFKRSTHTDIQLKVEPLL